ncbi:dTDP-4-dehydrorhamnose 3,5-epimerase [Bordetella hinzii]|uniref:dTDP-4-dehydrorhamnose 3,5-epimerase n=1 Tax=Bordetella hinzii OH87 BAL007II TaxID=1331262 RepID=A0ABR4QYL4_9BORD|nr:dTDP-4-dehydrorhamnose 3,5-epimerase [Bordetella hinzii]KCB23177.1 dTDP-4-dehydrorhamnose 3,5-epimerase [Bordetella hinzii OH87 BAL007II]QDJ41207.1 dTDP-4-dehydrorhamnose 3,5-epimerase [Bordetella hinzii]QDJ45762.1 dTDP-4-dehydrorhamnose 3,5-epimerase [Bordetella hinzii]QII83382.1 dTDP-4-dehydrorhamnose 3,5-epimerase [Bordetella hinzii]QWF40829.1 dTDP-4-dehydrorhamnose 3,5-epimerase [Bordetella hinzii]
MKLIPTALPGVVLVEPEVLADGRGWFAERFRQDVFEAGLRELGLPAPAPFVQENQSSSGLGVLRGLHYQLAPHAQGKLVSVVAGEIFDVAVDIRTGSPAFGQWLGVRLSAGNRRSLWIPDGFAHGFLSLAEGSEVQYKVTAYYAASHERALRWDDPAIGIQWPARPTRLSARDRQAPGLQEARGAGQLPA